MIMEERLPDYYETLQISPNADPETIHRVYRLLAQRFHPDTHETGDSARFRQITEAYRVLRDPESRAAFDVRHQSVRRERMRIVKRTHEGRRLAMERGVKMGRRPKLTAHQRARVVARLAAGETTRDLGVSHSTFARAR